MFAAPGDLRVEGKGTGGELVAGSALSADVTHLARYRISADTVVPLAEQDTSAASSGTRGVRVESCRLPEYQRDPVHCWHAGPP